jgi:biliverdin reductase
LSAQQQSLRIGIVGTGFAAKRRAEALHNDDRGQLVAVAGHSPEGTAAFAQTHHIQPVADWQTLANDPQIDLVMICTVNALRAQPIRAALAAGKHVVVEYPLCLDPQEAADLIALARAQKKLLHVEHIELLGGLHQALRAHLPDVGNIHYARYITLTPQHPVPQRWSYHHDLFGFPLSAALSRVHRLTDALGAVETVYSQARFWDSGDRYYTACLCNAQLRFACGAIAEIVYGKGDRFWRSERRLEIHGDKGTLIFESDQGQLIRGDAIAPIAVAGRRGLFAKDTQLVLDYLGAGKPLYVTPEASLYALRVAEAARQSAQTHRAIALETPQSASYQ